MSNNLQRETNKLIEICSQVSLPIICPGESKHEHPGESSDLIVDIFHLLKSNSEANFDRLGYVSADVMQTFLRWIKMIASLRKITPGMSLKISTYLGTGDTFLSRFG